MPLRGINPPLTTHDEPADVHDGEDVEGGQYKRYQVTVVGQRDKDKV